MVVVLRISVVNLVQSTLDRRHMTIAFQDLFSGAKRWRLWSMLAFDEWRLKYHRTIFGPLWIIFAFLAFILTKLLIFTNLVEDNADYYAAYLTIGFMVWLFLVQCLTEGGTTFVRSKNWILGIDAPHSVFLISAFLNCLINALVNAIPALAIAYIVYDIPAQNVLLAGPPFLAVAFCMFWSMLALSVLTVFSRDLTQLVATMMRIMFFLTPILWMPSQIGGVGAIVKYNPFAYLIDIVRQPLLEGTVNPELWIFVLSAGSMITILSLLIFHFAYKKIPSFI